LNIVCDGVEIAARNICRVIANSQIWIENLSDSAALVDAINQILSRLFFYECNKITNGFMELNIELTVMTGT